MDREAGWWKNGVVYQVYVRSFADGNGDGTGDIAGLRSRVPYLSALGVDAIWINPWYESPLNDGGYDVADYRSINSLFGTLDEARALIAECSEAGLRVMVDLVPNHTSSEHAWFQEALSAPPGSAARRRYHFLPGSGADGNEPPNDWTSVFGGSAWTRVADDEWYLHLFDPTQPDLNWSNSEVRDEFQSIIRFWLDMGASGFRVDVAHALVKDPRYPDMGPHEEHILETPALSNSPVWDRNELHEIVREWRQTVDEYEGAVMIAEAWVPSWERLARYIRPGEYHQAFDFHFLQSPWNAVEIEERIRVALSSAGKVGAVPTWVLSNHDVVRHATRYGLPSGVEGRSWLLNGDRSLLDTHLGLRRARAATLLMLALPGSVYLYQGEELGLPEVYDLPVELLEDPVWERSRHREKGRDGCRVPIPWSTEGPSFGFGSSEPWLPQPQDWGHVSVAAQDGIADSTLELYRSALRIRREHGSDSDSIEWIEGSDLVGFHRPALTCLVNFGKESIVIPDGRVLLASGKVDKGWLAPNDAVWLTEGDG